MSSGVERCKLCDASLVARTNGNGQVFLECEDLCGYVESVVQQADPHPTKYTMRKVEGGKMKRRRMADRLDVSVPYRHGILGPRDAAKGRRAVRAKAS